VIEGFSVEVRRRIRTISHSPPATAANESFSVFFNQMNQHWAKHPLKLLHNNHHTTEQSSSLVFSSIRLGFCQMIAATNDKGCAA